MRPPNTPSDAPEARQAHPVDPPGQHTFRFTYDDTGETTEVTAPNGWTLQRVIDEAYAELDETPQLDDRVEVGGAVLTAEQRGMKVKEFAERYGTSEKFHIVSKPGGAAARPPRHAVAK
jgi:YD repeat-containing protein